MARTPSDEIIMPRDEREPPARAGLSPRKLLFAGVASACLLGVGLGLWARPASNERRLGAQAAVVQPAPAPATPRKIQIVVDDTPAPIGPPLEVMGQHKPAVVGAVTAAALPGAIPAAIPFTQPTPMAPQMMAPVRSQTGLVRVTAVVPPQIAAPPVAPALKPPVVVQKVATVRPTAQAPRAARVERAVARPHDLAPPKARMLKTAARTQAKPVKLVPGKPRHVGSRKFAVNRQLDAPRQVLEVAQVHKPNPFARMAHVLVKVVAHHPDARAEKLAEAKARRQGRMEALAEARAEAKMQARLDARAEARGREAQLREARLVRAQKAALVRHEPARRPTIQLASMHRCASTDAGAALVCADARLGAVDRQMSRAFQQAQVAGVSAAELERQQRRWLAARSAAAREAPWAVRDVYLARIAELQGQAREARSGGD